MTKTLKVDYLSDPHVNHHVPFNHNQEKWCNHTQVWTQRLLQEATGDILIVAGDFSEWNIQAFWFLEECSKHYDHVFYTIGNHDYYLLSKNQRKKYGNSFGRINELFEMVSELDNVSLLHGHVVDYNGFTFGGHSLWYEPKTSTDVAWYETHSNDSVYIFATQAYNQHSFDILFKQAMDWYNSIEEQEFDVFVSHVPPINPPYGRRSNASYVAPVPYLAKTTHWICGHQHQQTRFKRHDIQFHMNPLGYPDEKNELTVKSFEITK